MNDKKVLIKAVNLKQYFSVGKNRFCKANDGISIDIYEGETFGLVGESGCGKSTFGRTLIQLNKQTSGKTLYYGKTLEAIAPRYVVKTLSNYKKLIQKYKKFAHKVNAAQKTYDELSEKSPDLFIKLNELNMLKAELENKHYDIASVLGGFITLKSPEKSIQLLKEEYSICRKIRKVLVKMEATIAKLGDAEYTLELAQKKGKSITKAQNKQKTILNNLEQLQNKKDKLEMQLAQKRKTISTVKKQYLNDVNFQEAEKYRDDGIDLSRLKYNEMRLLRSDLQMIFQDPYSSLNPRMTVGNIIGNGMKTHRLFIKENPRMQEEVLRVMEQCGLQPYFLHRFPHQFSGGQRQRIGIARSLAVRPKFVICDEAVSALDVSIQSQIINLLQDLKEQSNLTYLFITHDLSVVKYISNRIGVMYLGNIVELAPAQEIFSNPMHPYTQALIMAIPTMESRNKEFHILEGDIPSPINPPQGCKFHTRCRYCTEICKHVVPIWEEVKPNHFAACHHMRDIQYKHTQ